MKARKGSIGKEASLHYYSIETEAEPREVVPLAKPMTGCVNTHR